MVDLQSLLINQNNKRYVAFKRRINNMKKFLVMLTCFVLVLGIIACANSQKGGENMKNPKIEISVKDYGKIELELYSEVAPITVNNFVKLVNEKFYDGLTFHRIISGFMIQGGDPLGSGMGGSDETIKGEFISNGVNNKLSHKRGVISMARSSDPDSASSQFFICHADSEFLDGEYASFGKCTSGIEVVDAICKNVKVLDNNGTVAKEEQPVIEYIKIVE